MTLLTGAEAQLAEALAALGRFTGKVDAVLAAFEPEGTAAAEGLQKLGKWSADGGRPPPVTSEAREMVSGWPKNNIYFVCK